MTDDTQIATDDQTTPYSSLEDTANNAAHQPTEPQNLDDALAQVKSEKTQQPEPQNLDEALGRIKQERLGNQSAFTTTMKALPLGYGAPDSAVPAHNQAVDDFFKGTVGGRIANAFGYGADAGAHFGISEQSRDELAKTGILNDVLDAHGENHAGFVEGLLKPAAAGLGMELSGGLTGIGKVGGAFIKNASDAFGSAPIGTPLEESLGINPATDDKFAGWNLLAAVADMAMRGYSAAVEGAIGAAGEIGTQTGSPTLGKMLQEYPAALQAGYLPELGAIPHEVPLPREIAEASSSAAIGGPESVYFGLKEPAPEQQARIHEANAQLNAEPAVSPVETGPDIHEVARSLEPETFKKYDNLTAQQEQLRAQIDGLKNDRAQKFSGNEKTPKQIDDELSVLQKRAEVIVGDKDEAKLNAKKSAELADVRNQIKSLQALREHVSGTEPPETLALRQKIQDLDFQKRDLAPAVSEAYRNAQSQTPGAGIIPTEAQSIGESSDTFSLKPVEEQKQNIVSAEKQKLIDAGRPDDEADATAQLVAEHYQARSERFGGKRGNAEEMYAADGAEIKKGREVKARARELAQPEEGRELEQRAAQTETPEFKKWFGDSKVVDTDSAPLTVYHGTLKNFEAFDEAKRGEATGASDASQAFFFTSSPEVANTYAYEPNPYESNSVAGRLNKITRGRYQRLNEGIINLVGKSALPSGENVVPAYLKMENPLVVDSATKEYSEKAFKQIIDAAIVRGHDGVIFHNVKDEGFREGDGQTSSVYAVFDPKQIKSVFNRGTFDRKDSNLLHQKSQGKIRLATDDAKATITLMKSANASTFIHETGHHWFDELVRDSQHPEAPQQLKDDAETLLKYAGSDENGEIPTRGHEKVARSFERYLMEGTAPSKGLARVFAQFKNWLSKIYQTADKLRAPITDDIRDVFDRLLSSDPEKTVIASDHEPGKMLADIHERDAAETPPDKANEVADQIEREIDHTANLHNPEIHDAIKAAESNEVPSAPTGDQPVGPESQSGAAGQSVTEQSTTQPAGGSSAETESAAARGTTGDPSGTPARSDRGGAEPERRAGQPPNGTGEAFGEPESKLVDRAGNIRLDNLNTPEDVNTVLRETAKENDNFLGARRGVISAGQQLDLADALGMRPSDLDFRKIGQAFNAEQILAARKLLIQSATEVRNRMSIESPTEQDIAAYAEAKQRHLMIQEQVAGITAEAGRALGAFRKLAGSDEAKSMGDFLKQETGQDLYQLQQEMAIGKNLQTPAQIAKFLEDSKKPTFKDMVLEYYINNLISGPITHLRYSAGNALNALWTPLVEIPTAAVVGKIRELVTGDADAERVRLGEAGAQLSSLVHGSKEGMKAAVTAWKTGMSPLLPEEGEISNPTDGVKTNAIPGAIGQIINVPSRSVSAIHSFFKSLRYEQNIQGLAYRQAAQEGLGGKEFTDRVADLATTPSEEMMQSATANALKELFMQPTDYNSAMGKFQQAVNNNVAAKIILPFMKIGSQITRNAFIERTPLGLFDRDVRENLFGKNGGSAQDMQLAKMATGVGLMGTMSLMTLEGNATGDGPTDPNQRSIWLLNHTPNSIKIGDINIRYQGLGHLGMLMRFSANMTETAQGWDHEGGGKLATSFLEGITKSVLDENFMRGLKDMLDAVYHPEEYGDSYVRGFATNWLPFSVGLGQTTRQIDPYQRDINPREGTAQQIFDTARAKIPFALEGLTPKRDRFGNAIPNGSPLASYSQDPVVQKMESLQIGIGKLDRKIVGIPLSEQQYDDYSRIAGRLTKMGLDSIVNNPGFSDLSNATQIDIIHKTVSGAREAARSMVLADPNHPENREILRQAIQAKRDAIIGTKH